MRRFEGQLAVITASTAGIGLSIAERFASEGALVVISSRKQKNVDEALEKLKGTGKVKGIVCAVNNKEHRQQLFHFATTVAFPELEFRKIDVLVSNAACSPYFGETLQTPERAFDKLFEVNVKATFFLIAEAQNFLTDGASILIISSYLAFNPSSPIGIYGVTKTALLGLTKVLANELGQRKIRVR
ncbi:uncharacterized protein LOC129617823 [Condylostylus longicornis]|uniref:uncharacterized protein LOC129617823 n=1 Tax=Condylostylus longicornis TaxID=2530218 RepID=UPI00244DF256|nr:uncharacterized protein LOC129617823 [Condylostylus longicornis]